MDQTVVIYLIKFVWIKKYFALNGFYFSLHFTAIFFVCSALNAVFRFPHQQTEKAFSRYRQPDVLIFASIFDFYLLFYDVYGF